MTWPQALVAITFMVCVTLVVLIGIAASMGKARKRDRKDD